MFNNNPSMSKSALERLTSYEVVEPMTISGTIGKTLILILCAALSFVAIWYEALLQHIDKIMAYAYGGIIVGAILAFVIIFKPDKAKWLAPIYAFAEGLSLGVMSVFLEVQLPGIAFQAVSLTILALLAMLGLYKSRLVQATPKFTKVITTAMLSILILYLVNIVANIFFHFRIPMLSDSSPIGIAISFFIVLVAAFSFVLDFDRIESASKSLLPKDTEWYFAFGLMLTLVWLYVEILNLLSKLKRD